MPLDLLDLQRKTREVKAEFQGETITIKYAPHLYSSTIHNKLVALKKDPTFDPLVEVMNTLILDWDVTAGEGEFPPTTENLQKFPIMLLLAMSNSIMEDVMDTSSKKTKPSSGSGPKA